MNRKTEKSSKLSYVKLTSSGSGSSKELNYNSDATEEFNNNNSKEIENSTKNGVLSAEILPTVPNRVGSSGWKLVLGLPAL